MTKDQVVILLASAETLQQELERQFNKNRYWAEKALAVQDRLHYETRASSYSGLMMVNVTQIGAYQAMLKIAEGGFPVFSKAV